MTTCQFQWNLPLTPPSPRGGATRLVQLAGRGRGMKGEGTCEIDATSGFMRFGNSEMDVPPGHISIEFLKGINVKVN
jgi:hypothetical protein